MAVSSLRSRRSLRLDAPSQAAKEGSAWCDHWRLGELIDSLGPARRPSWPRGEDHAGARAIVDFIDDLVAIPSLGSAYRIYAYPTANPLSYTNGAPRKQTDRTVANETGRKVKFPEADLIEREIFVVQFHGLVIIETRRIYMATAAL